VPVETTRQLPPKVGGGLLFETVTEHERYLRVQILASLRLSQAIEVLAHELRHVLEVAEESSVVDEKGMIALSPRIGHPGHARGATTPTIGRLKRRWRRGARVRRLADDTVSPGFPRLVGEPEPDFPEPGTDGETK
jgi:hypothetical protein